MRRFLITTIIIASASWAGWHYAPAHVRERLLGFIGASRIPSRAAARSALERAILPEDRAGRRAAAASALRRVVADLEKRAERAELTSTMPEKITGDRDGAQDADADAVKRAEDLIRELESPASSEESLPRRAAERLLDAILPAQAGGDCPVK